MQKLGFGEEELAQLRVEATMHVDDDIPADFRPDYADPLEPKAAASASGRVSVSRLYDRSTRVGQFDAEGQPIAPIRKRRPVRTGP